MQLTNKLSHYHAFFVNLWAICLLVGVFRIPFIWTGNHVEEKEQQVKEQLVQTVSPPIVLPVKPEVEIAVGSPPNELEALWEFAPKSTRFADLDLASLTDFRLLKGAVQEYGPKLYLHSIDTLYYLADESEVLVGDVSSDVSRYLERSYQQLNINDLLKGNNQLTNTIMMNTIHWVLVNGFSMF